MPITSKALGAPKVLASGPVLDLLSDLPQTG